MKNKYGYFGEYVLYVCIDIIYFVLIKQSSPISYFDRVNRVKLKIGQHGRTSLFTQILLLSK